MMRSERSVTLKEWDSEYDTLHVAIDPARGGLHYSQITSLTARISELESRLERCAVGRSELRRRRYLLEKMKSRLSNAQASSNTTLRHLDHQRQVMQDHSRLVDDLGRGVERLNQQANIVHDEANLHVRLLDDMDMNMDEATEGLKKEADRAERIRRKRKTFWLYVTIVVLICILVMLISIGL